MDEVLDRDAMDFSPDHITCEQHVQTKITVDRVVNAVVIDWEKYQEYNDPQQQPNLDFAALQERCNLNHVLFGSGLGSRFW